MKITLEHLIYGALSVAIFGLLAAVVITSAVMLKRTNRSAIDASDGRNSMNIASEEMGTTKKSYVSKDAIIQEILSLPSGVFVEIHGNRISQTVIDDAKMYGTKKLETRLGTITGDWIRTPVIDPGTGKMIGVIYERP